MKGLAVGIWAGIHLSGKDEGIWTRCQHLQKPIHTPLQLLAGQAVSEILSGYLS